MCGVGYHNHHTCYCYPSCSQLSMSVYVDIAVMSLSIHSYYCIMSLVIVVRMFQPLSSLSVRWPGMLIRPCVSGYAMLDCICRCCDDVFLVLISL